MRRWILIGFAWWSGAAVGCVLGGPDEPGCSEDAECDDGFSCRAGACFKETPGGVLVPVDGGADGDAD